VIKTRGRTRRGLIVFGSTFGSMAQLARGLWQAILINAGSRHWPSFCA
jgi:hypothetical protein